MEMWNCFKIVNDKEYDDNMRFLNFMMFGWRDKFDFKSKKTKMRELLKEIEKSEVKRLG